MDRAARVGLGRRIAALSLASGTFAAGAGLLGPESAAAPSFRQSDAIVLNIPEAEMNDLLHDVFVSAGGPEFSGRQAKVSRGVTDLEYQVDVSEPTISLGEEGRMQLDFAIERADLRVARIEHKIAGRMAYCENTGLHIDPSAPLGVHLGLQFRVGNAGGLSIVTESVRLSDTDKIQFIKPARCVNTILPTWMVWPIAKSRLKKRVGTLDALLLEKARSASAKIDQDGGLLSHRWEISSLGEPGRRDELTVVPRFVDTSHGALFMSLEGRAGAPTVDSSAVSRPAGGSQDPAPGSAVSAEESAAASSTALTSPGSGEMAAHGEEHRPEWTLARADKTFVGISRSFLEAIMGAAFSGDGDTPNKPRGDLLKILKSSSIYALIPGLRDVQDRSDVSLTLAFRTPPTITFETLKPPPGAGGPPGRAPSGGGPDHGCPAGSEGTACEPDLSGTRGGGAFARDRFVGCGGTDCRETSPGPTPALGLPESAEPQADAQTIIRVHLSGIELGVWDKGAAGSEKIGSLHIDEGTLALAPYPNILGGVSFRLIENDWKASSSGIEINDALFQATIQELVYAEAFETLSEPVWREGIEIGGAKLRPARFSAVDDYLVIDLARF